MRSLSLDQLILRLLVIITALGCSEVAAGPVADPTDAANSSLRGQGRRRYATPPSSPPPASIPHPGERRYSEDAPPTAFEAPDPVARARNRLDPPLGAWSHPWSSNSRSPNAARSHFGAEVNPAVMAMGRRAWASPGEPTHATSVEHHQQRIRMYAVQRRQLFEMPGGPDMPAELRRARSEARESIVAAQRAHAEAIRGLRAHRLATQAGGAGGGIVVAPARQRMEVPHLQGVVDIPREVPDSVVCRNNYLYCRQADNAAIASKLHLQSTWVAWNGHPWAAGPAQDARREFNDVVAARAELRERVPRSARPPELDFRLATAQRRAERDLAEKSLHFQRSFARWRSHGVLSPVAEPAPRSGRAVTTQQALDDCERCITAWERAPLNWRAQPRLHPAGGGADDRDGSSSEEGGSGDEGGRRRERASGSGDQPPRGRNLQITGI